MLRRTQQMHRFPHCRSLNVVDTLLGYYTGLEQDGAMINGPESIPAISVVNLRQKMRQMMLTEILVNPSVKPEDELRLSRQAKEIYDLLQLGPVWTNELAAIACQYNARLNEIRQALMEIGLTVDLTEEGPGGNNKYEIVEFEGSKYQSHLRKRGLI